MAGKKKGKASQEKKEQKKQRQEAKQSKATKKQASKDAKAVGEESIESILADIAKKEAERTHIDVTVCPIPPSPRANFSLTATPTGDLLLFGGEYYDGQTAKCHNELLRWSIDKGEWRLIESPNTPPPRCSHQALTYKEHLYIFGGEFATSEQFFHYKDLWRLDIKTSAWEEIEIKGKGPSARSGHRMVVWRNYLVLFGGFYEAFRETKWFNDLYLMSLQDFRWQRIDIPPTAVRPSARSGHQLAIHVDQMFLYGGYSKEKEAGKKSEGKVHNDQWVLNLKPVLSSGIPVWDRIGKKGVPPTPRSGATMTVHKGRALLFGGVYDKEGPHHELESVFYNDLYAFDMERRQWYRLALKTPKEKGEGGKARKMKKRLAGVEEEGKEDVEEEEEEEEEDFIDSEDEETEENRYSENAFVYIDEHGKLQYIEPEEDEEQEEEKKRGGGDVKAPAGAAAEDSEACLPPPPTGAEEGDLVVPAPSVASDASPPPEPQRTPTLAASAEEAAAANAAAAAAAAAAMRAVPLPRINPALVVRGNTLFIYGGLLEVKDREYTLDDCWSIDLNTRTEWKRCLEGTMDSQVWRDDAELDSEMGSEMGADEHEDDEDEDDEWDEEDDGYGDEDEEEDVQVVKSIGMTCVSLDDDGEEQQSSRDEEKEKARQRKKQEKKEGKERKKEGIRGEIRRLQEQLALDDPNRTPNGQETLREFYARTWGYWVSQWIARLEAQGSHEKFSEKELRRDAFALAAERFEELAPVLSRLAELEAERAEREAEKRNAKSAAGGGRKHR